MLSRLQLYKDANKSKNLEVADIQLANRKKLDLSADYDSKKVHNNQWTEHLKLLMDDLSPGPIEKFKKYRQQFRNDILSDSGELRWENTFVRMQLALKECLEFLDQESALKEYEKAFAFIEKFTFEKLHKESPWLKDLELVNSKSVLIIANLGDLVSEAGWTFYWKVSRNKLLVNKNNEVLENILYSTQLSADVFIEMAVRAWQSLEVSSSSEKGALVATIKSCCQEAEKIIQRFFGHVAADSISFDPRVTLRLQLALYCTFSTRALLHMKDNNLELAEQFIKRCALIKDKYPHEEDLASEYKELETRLAKFKKAKIDSLSLKNLSMESEQGKNQSEFLFSQLASAHEEPDEFFSSAANIACATIKDLNEQITVVEKEEDNFSSTITGLSVSSEQQYVFLDSLFRFSAILEDPNGQWEEGLQEIDQALEISVDETPDYAIEKTITHFSQFFAFIQNYSFENLLGKPILNGKPLINTISQSIIIGLIEIQLKHGWNLALRYKDGQDLILSFITASIFQYARTQQYPVIEYLQNGTSNIDVTFDIKLALSQAPSKNPEFYQQLKTQMIFIEIEEFSRIRKKLDGVHFTNSFLITNLFIRENETYHEAKKFLNECENYITEYPADLKSLSEYYTVGQIFFTKYLAKYPVDLKDEHARFKRTVLETFPKLCPDSDPELRKIYEQTRILANTILGKKNNEFVAVTKLFESPQSIFENASKDFYTGTLSFDNILKMGQGDWKKSLAIIDKAMEQYMQVLPHLHTIKNMNILNFFKIVSTKMLEYTLNHNFIRVFQALNNLPVINTISVSMVTGLMDILIKHSWTFLVTMKREQNVILTNIVNATILYVETQQALGNKRLSEFYTKLDPTLIPALGEHQESIDAKKCFSDADKEIQEFFKKLKELGIKIDRAEYKTIENRLKALQFDNDYFVAVLNINGSEDYEEAHNMK